MDLRIQRTKSAIREAFFELRKKKSVEKITVTELSKLAGINKATFYLHYTDIYSLSDEIEDEIIERILSGINIQENFFSKPQTYAAEFANEVFLAFSDNQKRLLAVFSGSRYSLFSAKIEKRIKAMLYERFPDFNTYENDITLTFLIQGGFHTLANFRDEDRAAAQGVVSRFTSEMFERLIEK